MARGGGIFWVLIYIVFGAYFIISGLPGLVSFKIPEVITKIDNWITLVGGVLILIGGINHFRTASNKRYRRE